MPRILPGLSPLRERIDHVHDALQGEGKGAKGMKKRVPRIQQAAEALRQAISEYEGPPEYLAEAYSVLCSTLSICHSLQDPPGRPPDLIELYKEGI